MIRSATRTILAPLALLLVAGPAAGQNSTSALRGLDRNSPIDVAADRIELQDRADRAVLSGNVEVKQGNMELEADRLTVAYTREGGTEIRRLDASGNVRLVSPSERARSQYAIYDLDRRLITMIGNVVLMRGSSEVRGGRLVIDLASGRATVDGSSVGGSKSSGGRVTGRFTVPSRGD